MVRLKKSQNLKILQDKGLIFFFCCHSFGWNSFGCEWIREIPNFSFWKLNGSQFLVKEDSLSSQHRRKHFSWAEPKWRSPTLLGTSPLEGLESWVLPDGDQAQCFHFVSQHIHICSSPWLKCWLNLVNYNGNQARHPKVPPTTCEIQDIL